MKSNAKLLAVLLAGIFVLSFVNVSCSNGSDSSLLAFIPTSPTNPTEPTNGGTGGDNGSGGGTTTNPTSPTNPTNPTDPTNPTNPTDSTNPTNPEQQTQTIFTVTFQTECGTLPDQFKNGITVNENDKLTAEQLPALTADGFAFGGWMDGETLVVAGEYTVTKNVVLTAKWTVATVSYTVSFVNVGDEYSDCTSPSSVSLPSSVTLPENTILMETNIPEPTYNDMWYNNWRFDGWYEYKGKNYGWGEKVEAGKYVLKKDVTLIAIWKPAYTIRFYANGGAGEMSDYITTCDEKKILVCPEKDTGSNQWPHLKHEFLPNNAFTTTREGYIFDGWTRAYNGCEGEIGIYILEPFESLYYYSKPKSLNFYATWKPARYTVRFDTQKGKVEDVQYTYGETHTYSYLDTEISNEGVHISSWNTKPDGTGTSYPTQANANWRNVDIGEISTEHGSIITLYAQWEKNYYYVRLAYDTISRYDEEILTETGEKSTTMKCMYGESYILKNPFILTKYYIEKWERQDNKVYYEPDSVLYNLTNEHCKTIILDAWLTSSSYIIAFDPNGASNDTAMTSRFVTAYPDEEITLPKNRYIRNGYTFICWEGGYLDEDKVKNLAPPHSSIALKPVWAKVGESLTLTAPARNAVALINLMPSNAVHTLKLNGQCDESIILQIGVALKAKNISLDLHLEDTTGLTKISGLSDCTNLRNIYLSTETKIAANALYGCTNLEGVYYPNYKSNRYIFKASGSSTNRWMTIEKKSNVPAYLTCEYQIDQGYGPLNDDPVFVNKVFANILAGNAEDPSIKTFRGYEYEWRVME